MANDAPNWPPLNGAAFIRSEAFGEMLVNLVERLTMRYPQKDFTDAVAQVFTWFDTTLARNRRFINSRRFPTEGAFRAYLHQSLWNASRRAERDRQRHGKIEDLPGDLPMIGREEDPAQLLGMIDGLPEPQRTVFKAIFFRDEDATDIAGKTASEVAEIQRIYDQAADQIALHELAEHVNGLPEPHKTVFEKILLEDANPDMLASTLDLTIKDVERIYDEAADMLAQSFE